MYHIGEHRWTLALSSGTHNLLAVATRILFRLNSLSLSYKVTSF